MTTETIPSADWVSLASTQLAAQIDPMGAQLSTLRNAEGRDLLWDGNPAVWAGRAPLLFPIVGTLSGGRYRLGADTYALSRHGFARVSRFTVIDTAPTRATFRLSSDTTTRQVYPFEFDLDVAYLIEEACLTVQSTLYNRGSESLPASLGYHPAFRWPLPFGQSRAAHFIEFDTEEPAPARQLDADGLLSPESIPTPIHLRRLVLDDALFRNDAVIFDALRSRRVTYGAARGPRIDICFPDSEYLGVWTKPGADFICIEPWNGIADPAGYRGDFTHKPGVFHVAPNAGTSIKITIALVQ